MTTEKSAADPDVAELIERLHDHAFNEPNTYLRKSLSEAAVALQRQAEELARAKRACEVAGADPDHHLDEQVFEWRDKFLAAEKELAEAKEIIRRLLSDWPWPELDRAKAQKFLDAALSEGKP